MVDGLQRISRGACLSPFGTLSLSWTEAGLCRIDLPKTLATEGLWWKRWFGVHRFESQPVPLDWAEQFADYFAGRLKKFDLPLDLRGTPFQLEIWRLLCEIPLGRAISYRELAGRSSRPKGYQAVGAANGRNPVPIVVPCHRVIAADGTIGGYGGGLPMKEHLLRLERVPPAQWSRPVQMDLFAAVS